MSRLHSNKQKARPSSGPQSPKAGKPSQLAVRRVLIDTYHENVAYLHRQCAFYRAEGFKVLSKIEVKAKGKSILATLNVVDDAGLVAEHELGLSHAAFEQLDMAPGSLVEVAQAEAPGSMHALHRKLAGERLQLSDFQSIVNDIASHRYSKIELTAFVVACNRDELDREEVCYLTQAMIAAGKTLSWNAALVVDKHCIGGIPGNRTSMLVVPIVAAHGMLCPKTSSRAITSPAGTADTMEVLANVELPLEALRGIVQRHNACLAWGGTAHLSPADDVLISVERPLAMDSAGQMVASILSKKVSAGSTHLLLDIPIGPTAKVRTISEAQRLRRLFEYVSRHLDLSIDVVITDGRQPIGFGVGPVLEARDVMRVLQNDPLAPLDLREKSLRLAGRLIEFDPDVRGGDGYAIARDILDSGRALQKMNDLILAQGAHAFDYKAPVLGQLSFDVRAPGPGHVTSIDNLQIARIAGLAGAPKIPCAGLELHRKLGDRVKKGELLYRVFAGYPSDLAFARRSAERSNAYTIGKASDVPQVFVDI